MRDFITRRATTYKRLTLEFLATLELNKEDNTFSFQLLNTPYKLSQATLREIFGVEEGERVPCIKVNERMVNDFWLIIAQRPFGKRGQKNSVITHPGFRIIHRVFAMCFFCQGEPTHISTWETQQLLSFTPEKTDIPDWVALWLDFCIETQGAKKGKIAMGGMITLIAKHFKIDLRGEMPISGPYTFNTVSLKNARMMVVEPKLIWCYGSNADHYLRLPRQGGFPVGPTNAELYVAPDSDLVPKEGYENEEEIPQREVLEPFNANVGGGDWKMWRQSVDDQLKDQSAQIAALHDNMSELLAYSRAQNDMYKLVGQGYVEPDVTQYRENEKKRKEDKELQAALRASRTQGHEDGAGPSGSR